MSWQDAIKIARHTSMNLLMLDGSSRGFKLLVRDNVDVPSVKLLGLDNKVVQ